MPEIKQYDWSKLQPKQVGVGSGRGTKDYATQEIIEISSKSKNSAITKIKPPINKQRKKTKVKDKRLFNDIYDQDQHLRSI